MSTKRSDKLSKYLNLIRATYKVQALIDEKQKEDEIKKYYLSNHFAYLFFHNKDGFMHMGISRNNKYNKEDLLEPLKIINKYIHDIHANSVLELGAGNGSNSAYLAKLNKDVSFQGMDLSKDGLSKNKKVKNYIQELGDYHNLSRYKDEDFDVVFVIEALCHSPNKLRVLSEVYKKLKQGGLFIILDGYYSKSLSEMSSEEQMASQLTEKSMVVNKFKGINDFNKTISQTKFKLIKQEDLSKAILPSLRRFEKLALLFYKNKILTKTIKLVLPDNLTKNSIAGLLMPTLIERGIGCYYLHVLQK